MKTTLPPVAGKTIELSFFPPYNLTQNDTTSDRFYFLLEEFTKKVVDTGLKHFGSDIANFRETGYATNKVSDEELLLELLMTGVFWNTYKGRWQWNLRLITPMFKMLYRLRSTILKSRVDKLRGKLGNRLLNKPGKETLNFSIDQFDNLLYWLSATGDFKMEVKALSRWQDYFYFELQRNSLDLLEEVSAFASWFEDQSKIQLGSYTGNVSSFLQHNKKMYAGREDQFFCTRTQVEYHMNMVGAQIMNNSLRKDFLRTEKKILLLPTCMIKNKECKAKVTDNALICQHCTSDCNVSKTAREMKISGIETVLIRHSSDFSRWLKPWANQNSTGLIGTACVLNLLGGGYEMKNLNIPSQCVFLDYCGCNKHWNKTGIATRINTEQAKALVSLDGKKERTPEIKRKAV